MISEELKEQNYQLFIKKLEDIGIDTKLLQERYGEKIKNASYAAEKRSNCAYDGSLINTVLRTTTGMAIKINELLPESVRADKNSIIKVCLLNQLSKSLTFIKNDNNWEVENRGLVYKYAETKIALKCGMKSLIMCQECGIQFNPYEIEGMIILDREDSDIQAKVYSSPLSVVVRQANELTNLKNRLNG